MERRRSVALLGKDSATHLNVFENDVAKKETFQGTHDKQRSTISVVHENTKFAPASTNLRQRPRFSSRRMTAISDYGLQRLDLLFETGDVSFDIFQDRFAAADMAVFF